MVKAGKKKENISVLELKAAKFAILTFTKIFAQTKIIHCQMNITATLPYIAKNWGYPQQSFVRSSQRNLELLSNEWVHNHCRVFTMNTQGTIQKLCTL